MEVNQNKTSVAAVIGMILGCMAILSSIVLGGFYLGIPGFIVSIIALVNIKKKELGGKGLAIAGTVLSVLALIASILVVVFVVFVVDTTTEAVGNKAEQYSDLSTAQNVHIAVWDAYFEPEVYEEMQEYTGDTISFTENVYYKLPESFRTEFEENMGTSGVPVPAYTDNGAKYFAVQFAPDGCEVVYVTDGVTFWELYPVPCEEYE